MSQVMEPKLFDPSLLQCLVPYGNVVVGLSWASRRGENQGFRLALKLGQLVHDLVGEWHDFGCIVLCLEDAGLLSLPVDGRPFEVAQF